MHQIVEFITRIHQTFMCDIAMTLYGFACCICRAYIYGSRDLQKGLRREIENKLHETDSMSRSSESNNTLPPNKTIFTHIFSFPLID